jgi:signal transduction histidine kinase
MSEPRSIDSYTFRLACVALLVGYSVIVLKRPTSGHPEFFVIRLLVWLLALGGAVWGRRFAWHGIRAYSITLALLLPLGSSYIDTVLGNGPSELLLTALATYIPLVFLQTGLDIIVVGAILFAGDALLLWLLPSPVLPLITVALFVHGSVGVGMAAGMMMLAYRARLQESMQRLDRALRAKNDFLQTMSHELRSPLHVIMGYAEMLGEGGAVLREEALGERIRLSALELLQLVENTMNAARLEAGKVTLRIDDFAPQEVVTEIAENVGALPEAKSGVPVEWQVSVDLPRVRLDRLKVKEIIQNLVSNALKFTTEGRVLVAVDREGEQLRIAVRDTGCGIAPDAQARIFDVFERLEKPGAQQPAGIGLGLYIVRALIQLMRGRIDVESQPGKGSCFTVRLPLRLHESLG